MTQYASRTHVGPDAGKVFYVPVGIKPIPKLVQWWFLLFIFTFPFEATDLGFMRGSLSVAKIAGVLFFAIYCFYYYPVSGRTSFPAVPTAMWWFLGYVGIYVLHVVTVPPDLFGQFVMRVFTLLQLIAFFWIVSDLLKDQKMVTRALLTYLISTGLLALGIILRVPGFYQEVVTGRVTGVGENLNLFAMHMAIALIIAIGLFLSRVYKDRRVNVALVCLTLPVLVAMIGTGSRGGIAAFVVGTSMYLVPYWQKKRKMAAISFAVLGIIVVGFLIATTPELLKRWEESYYEGKLSDREKIFGITIEMISMRPVFGWGAIESGYMLGFRGGQWDPMDTHNLFLHLLLEAGIMGTIPFLTGLCLCVRKAWQARTGRLGLLPLALIAMALTANLSGNNVVWKPQWLVLALAIGTSAVLTRKIVATRGTRVAIYGRTGHSRTGSLTRNNFEQRHGAK